MEVFFQKRVKETGTLQNKKTYRRKKRRNKKEETIEDVMSLLVLIKHKIHVEFGKFKSFTVQTVVYSH